MKTALLCLILGGFAHGLCPQLAGLYDRDPSLKSARAWKLAQKNCDHLKLSLAEIEGGEITGESLVLTLMPEATGCGEVSTYCRTFLSDDSKIWFHSGTCMVTNATHGRCRSSDFQWNLDGAKNLVETCVKATCEDGYSGDVSQTYFRRH